MRRENFLEDVWSRGGGENDDRAQQKVFSPKWGENFVGENQIGEGQKCPCANCKWALIRVVVAVCCCCCCCCCYFYFIFFLIPVLITV